MAGRNKAKMEELRAFLAKPGQDLSDVRILEADVNDPASLDALAASASVVITMVGPYALYGRPVVQVRSLHCGIAQLNLFVPVASCDYVVRDEWV
jgi:short subunit dehydrogenase-like uncharacterized protein